jgi:hypothetical protein
MTQPVKKPQAMLREMSSYGFGVYSANGKIVVADPEDDEDGFGVECDSLEEAYAAWDSAWALR